MSDYTPTTEEVREGYSYWGIGPDDEWRQPKMLEKHGAEFDRWLAEVERAAAAGACAEGYMAASPIRMGPRHNPYRKGR